MNNEQTQDLRERAWMLFNELDGMLERLPKEANWFGNVDHIKQNVNLLKKEFQFAAEVAGEKDNSIIALQESEMRLIDANSRQEQRIAELEKQVYYLKDEVNCWRINAHNTPLP